MTFPKKTFKLRLMSAGFMCLLLGVASCQTTYEAPNLDSEPAPPGFYRVRKGDSLSSIAATHQVSALDIIKANGLGTRPPKVGQLISIPQLASSASAAPVAAVTAPAPVALKPESNAEPASVVQKTRPNFPEVQLPAPSWQIENVALAGLSSTAVSTNEAASLSDVLQSTLSDTGYFRIRARSDIDAILKEQIFQKNQSCDDPAYLVEVGKLLATRKMVGGSIGKVGNTYIVSLRMVNVETGQIEVSEHVEMDNDADYLINLTEYVGRLMAKKYAASVSANR